jgi:hypothetical protein
MCVKLFCLAGISMSIVIIGRRLNDLFVPWLSISAGRAR